MGPKISCSILQYHTGKNKNRKTKQTLKTHGKSNQKVKIINSAKLYRLLDGFLHQKDLFGPLVNFYNVFSVTLVGKLENTQNHASAKKLRRRPPEGVPISKGCLKSGQKRTSKVMTK